MLILFHNKVIMNLAVILLVAFMMLIFIGPVIAQTSSPDNPVTEPTGLTTETPTETPFPTTLPEENPTSIPTAVPTEVIPTGLPTEDVIPTDEMDVTPPEGTIIIPISGTYFDNPLLLTTNAVDLDSGIDRVEFYASYTVPIANWILVGVANSEPYEYSWDWSGFDGGLVIISATIFDKTGNSMVIENPAEIMLEKQEILTVEINESEISAFDLKPGTPALLSPASAVLVSGYTPILDWTDPTPAAVHYELMLFTNLTTPVIEANPTDLVTSTFTCAELEPNTTYYWKVRGVSFGGQIGNWTVARSFRTKLLSPGLNLPVDIGHTLTTRPTFTWDIVGGAKNYSLQVASNLGFTTGLKSFTAAGGTYTPTVDLTRDVTLYWRVKANGTNPSDYSLVRSFHSANPPAVPIQVSPLTGMLVADYKPTLTWKAGTGTVVATKYEIELANNAAFSLNESLITIDPAALTYTFPDDLESNKTWYWRVRSLNADGEYSLWSTSRTFRTKMLPPVLSSPAEGAEVLTIRPTFTWSAVPGATNYTLQVASNAGFTLGLKTFTTTSAPGYTPTVDLPRSITLFWRVKANGANPSDYALHRSFVSANPPAVPSLVSPLNGTLILGYRPTLTWKAGLGLIPITKYQIEMATNAAFTTDESIIDIDPPALSYVFTSDLLSNKSWYWRVRSLNADGEYSLWSTSWSFRTKMLPPVLTYPLEGNEVKSVRPTFTWDAVPGAKNYTLLVSSNSSFTTGLKTFTTTAASSYTPAVDLTRDVTLFWKLKANGTNPSDYSLPISFESANPPAIPKLTNPASNALVSGVAVPELGWLDGTDSLVARDHFEIQISSNATFTSLDMIEATSAFTSYAPGVLASNKTWYWRVRSVGTDASYSLWSPARTFRTKLDTPVLSSPAPGVTTPTARPTFIWGAVTGAASYTLQISTNNAFTTGLKTFTVPATTFTLSSDLTHNALFYWRVKANGPNVSDWSTIGNFQTPT